MSIQAVACCDIQCIKGCSFTGGNSGYCSSCWRSLTDEEKLAANSLQAPLQEERARLREARLGEEREAEQKRQAKWVAEQEGKRQDSLKKLKLEEEAEAAREEIRCQRVASHHMGVDLSPPEWLQWNWVTLDAIDDEGSKLLCPSEYGTCGLYNAVSFPLARHKHAETSTERMGQLFDLSRQLSERLRNTQDGSSEGGEPWVGFFVLPGDMPSLSQKSSSELIMQAVLGAPFSRLLFEQVKVNDHRIFAGASGCEGDALQAYKDATALIFSVAKKDTVFRLVPACNGDYYVGPCFLGARTSEGDVIGIRSRIVWT